MSQAQDQPAELIRAKFEGAGVVEKLLVYGTRWCGDCKRTVRILDERQVEYDFIDIDRDQDGHDFVKETNQGNRSVPTIIFPDKSKLVEPSNQQLIDKLESIGK